MSVPIRMDVFRTYKSRAAMGRGGPALNYALCDGPMGALLRNSARVATPIWKVEPLPKVASSLDARFTGDGCTLTGEAR